MAYALQMTMEALDARFSTEDTEVLGNGFGQANLPALQRSQTHTGTGAQTASLPAKGGLRKTKSDDVYPLPDSLRSRSLSPHADDGIPRGRSKSPFQMRRSSKSPHHRKLVGRSVSFDKVQVREFEQILGDTPARDAGPSLGLGWSYNEKKATNVDKFEAKRTGTSVFARGSRRKGRVSALSPKVRHQRAQKLGFAPIDIEMNRLENIEIWRQRDNSKYDGECPEGDADSLREFNLEQHMYKCNLRQA